MQTVFEIRNRIAGVLKDPGGIRHVQQMIQPQCGQVERAFLERGHRVMPARFVDQAASGQFERVHVQMSHIAPDHLAAQHVGSLPHGMVTSFVRQ